MNHLLQTSTSVATTNPTFPGPVPSKLMTPPPGLSSSWGFLETPSISSKEEEVFEEEQDPCVICHEEMTLDTTVKLECHHRFHDEVRKISPFFYINNNKFFIYRGSHS